MGNRSTKLGISLIAFGLIAFSSSLLAQDDITSLEAIERHTNEMMEGARRNAEAFDRRQDARAQEAQMEQLDRRLDSMQREQKRQSNDAYWHNVQDSLDRR